MNRILLFPIIFLFSLSIYSQSNSGNGRTPETNTQNQQNTVNSNQGITADSLKKLIYNSVKAALNNQYNVNTGVLELKRKEIKYYINWPTNDSKINGFKLGDSLPGQKKKNKYEYESDGTLIIDSMKADLYDGYLRDFRVYCKDGRVFKHYLPIGVKGYDGDKSLRLAFQDYPAVYNADTTPYIYLRDFLYYDPSPGKNFHPSDVSITFTKDDTSRILGKKASLNDLFNVSLFTDLLGDLNVSPNGLFQTEISFNERLNTQNIRNHSAFWGNYIYEKVTLRKFDSQYKSTPIADTISSIKTGMIDRMMLIQTSAFDLDLGINLLHAFFGKQSYHTFSWNFGGELALNKVFSLKDTNQNGILLLPSFYTEIILEFKFSDNFGLNIYNKASLQFLAGDKINSITNNELETVFSHTLLFYYSPGSKLNSNIFFRGGVTYSPLPDAGARAHIFPTIQIGYQVKFSDFINMNTK